MKKEIVVRRRNRGARQRRDRSPWMIGRNPEMPIAPSFESAEIAGGRPTRQRFSSSIVDRRLSGISFRQKLRTTRFPKSGGSGRCVCNATRSLSGRGNRLQRRATVELRPSAATRTARIELDVPKCDRPIAPEARCVKRMTVVPREPRHRVLARESEQLVEQTALDCDLRLHPAWQIDTNCGHRSR